jgi:hypothetical protein
MVVFDEILKPGGRHIGRDTCYVRKYCTSDMMIHGMAPIPNEKAIT